MSALAREFFQDNPVIAGPLLAMAIFVLIFLFAAWRAARAGQDHVARMERMPLGDEEVTRG